MNQKQILECLQNNPTDGDIGVAIDWLKQRRPTSKTAHRVLRELIQRPQLEPELPWLAEWMQEGPWDELLKPVATTKSLVLFEWIVKLLEDNPSHLQAGQLWFETISNCRDYDLATKATQWTLHNAHGDYPAGLLVSRLLDDAPTPALQRKTQELLKSDPEDFSLITALIESERYGPAIELGLKLLQTENEVGLCCSVGAALLKIDGELYFPAAEAYLRRLWSHEFIHLAIQDFMESAPALMLPVLIEWVEEKRNAEIAPKVLIHVLLVSRHQAMADYAWSWCAKRLPKPSAFEIFESLFWFLDHITLPFEALEYAQTWLQSDKGHKSWTVVAAGLVAASPLEEKLRQGLALLGGIEEEEQGPILLALVRHAGDPKSIALAKAWCAKFSNHKLAVAMILALIERSPDRELLAQAKSSKSSENTDMDWQLLVALVIANDQESVIKAKEWLKTRRINRRWTGTHRKRGALILALLRSRYRDQEILEYADEWLRLRPAPYEKEQYDLVRAAFDESTGKHK